MLPSMGQGVPTCNIVLLKVVRPVNTYTSRTHAIKMVHTSEKERAVIARSELWNYEASAQLLLCHGHPL